MAPAARAASRIAARIASGSASEAAPQKSAIRCRPAYVAPASVTNLSAPTVRRASGATGSQPVWLRSIAGFSRRGTGGGPGVPAVSGSLAGTSLPRVRNLYARGRAMQHSGIRPTARAGAGRNPPSAAADGGGGTVAADPEPCGAARGLPGMTAPGRRGTFGNMAEGGTRTAGGGRFRPRGPSGCPAGAHPGGLVAAAGTPAGNPADRTAASVPRPGPRGAGRGPGRGPADVPGTAVPAAAARRERPRGTPRAAAAQTPTRRAA